MDDSRRAHLERMATALFEFPRRVHTGTLCLYGDWVGRPMDNLEVPLSASVHEDHLRILFERDLVLEVWDPAAWQVEGVELSIPTARRVRLGHGRAEFAGVHERLFEVVHGVLEATDHDGNEVKGATLSRPAVLIV